jgi:alpha-D-ribose 1-methylphosphonate 5-triphosphate diphosphatase
VFELHRRCGLALAEAFALVTRNPAYAVGLGGELGEIAEGRRADLLIIASREAVQGGDAIPVVERVFVEGHPVFAVGYPSPTRDHAKQVR